MQHITTRETMQQWRRDATKAGSTIAFVPTMGALHAGHMALVTHAHTLADLVLVSIFVNPTQFGAGEDFSSYPRTVTQDMAILADHGTDACFTPSVTDIYPDGFDTHIKAGALATQLCGAHRPGHFDGVLTVLSIFNGLIRPDIMLLGEKDYQQLALARRLYADFSLHGSIKGIATKRDADGLALSSRNQYLSAHERKIAPALYALLKRHAALLAHSTMDALSLRQYEQRMHTELLEAGFTSIDYLGVYEQDTLQPTHTITACSRLFAAVKLGTTRLIDNLAISSHHADT